MYYSKQKWNHDKCRFKCKELDDFISCKKGYKTNFRTCNCECDKAYKIGEYLNIKKAFFKNDEKTSL